MTGETPQSEDLPDNPWKVIGGIAKEDVEPIEDHYFDKRKIWRSDEWQDKRAGEDTCEWCGDETDEIQLHHIGSTAYNIDWYSVWDEIAYDLFEEFGTYNASMDRGSELYVKHVVYFVRQNRGLLAWHFKQEVQRVAHEYINQEEIVPLCKSCHYAWEKKRMKICGVCGDSYGKYRKDDDLPEYACWGCVTEEKGLEECDCGGWFDPEKHDACSDCRGPHRNPSMGDPT